MRTNRKSVLMAAVASVCGASVAQAATQTWDGGGANPLWSTPQNWISDTAPVALDSIVFDANGVAVPNNEVDASALYTKLTYSVDDPTKVYNTVIDNGVTLSLNTAATSNIATPANASLLVMPVSSATNTPIGTVVKISSQVGGTGELSITNPAGNLAFNVTGKPGLATQTAENFAILDMTGLSKFTFSTSPSFTFSNFAVGIGNGVAGDNGIYSGKVILSDNTTINANRITIGAATNAGALGNQATSLMLMGQTTNLNTGLSGVIYVGADGTVAAKDPSGGLLFRAGLTNPVATLGSDGAGRIALRVGQHNLGTGHSVFGVLDGTSASGGSEGTINAFTAGTFAIGRGSTSGAGGGAAMVSTDKGTLDGTGNIVLATTGSNQNAVPILGYLNVGVKGAATDVGAGTVQTTTNLIVGQRAINALAVSTGVVTVANNGAVTADRTFLADNTAADNANGAAVGQLNLDGGVLTTGQIQAGSDTAQVGTKNTRIVNFNGGTLKTKTGSTKASTYMQNLSSAIVYSGGATFDTNGVDTTVGQALVAPSGSGLSSVSVTTPGSGYRTAPIVVVNRGTGDTTGIGATAVAQIDGTGAVTGVTITNPGTDYTVAPTFSLVSNAGTTFAAMQLPVGNWNTATNTYVPGVVATLAGTIAANAGGGITKIGTGTLNLNGANTYTGPTSATAGKLVFGQSLTTSSSVSASNDAVIQLKNVGTHNQVIKTGPVATSGTAKIDLTDNKLITTTVPGTATAGVYAAGSVQGMVQSGLNGGTWDGPGIITSEPDALASKTTIGVATGAQARGLGPTDTDLFAGQTIDGNSTLAMYTYAGDANLDGTINPDDYALISFNASVPGADGYYNGDFNYDGVINPDDFALIDFNFNAQGAPFPTSGAVVSGGLAVTAVPEPASLGLMAVAATGLLSRRRRSTRSA